MTAPKSDIIAALQSDILRLQGFRPVSSHRVDIGLGAISQAFPEATFPTGAVHEFISAHAEDTAATVGFITGLISGLMEGNKATLWISASRMLFPPSLSAFGVQPDRIIFADLPQQKEVLWATEEALKCGALTAVIAEVNELSFTESRRLQLAVEQSRVTGFILRKKCRNLNTTACVSRWKITSLPGEIIEDLPGVGYPKWRVELLRMRNGKSGVWEIIWKEGRFHHVFNNAISSENQTRKTG